MNKNTNSISKKSNPLTIALNKCKLAFWITFWFAAVINLLMQATRFSWLGTAINWNRRCNSWITRFTVDRCSWICSNSIVWDSYLSCCFGGSNRATVCLRLTILNRLVLFLQLLFGANSSTFGSALSRISNSCHRCIHMCEHTLIQFRSLWAYCQTCVRSVNHDLVAFSR